MKKKVFIILIVCLIFILGGLFFYLQDSYRFKFEYEVYNQTEFAKGKKIDVKIPLDNPVQYVSSRELVEVLTKKTGVIYFGYPTCPWCRNAVPVLLDTLQENEGVPLYYVDCHEVNVEKALDILKPYLDKDESGNERLYVPDVYFVKEGDIVFHHIGTVESLKNPYQGMNAEQIRELKQIYQEGIDKIMESDKNEE